LIDNLSDLKDKLIEALQVKFIENEKRIENIVDITCATNNLIHKSNATCNIDDLIQIIDVSCDTHDLIVDIEETKSMDNDSLISHEMETYSELVNMSHKKKI
jgi:hypothetical protein